MVNVKIANNFQIKSILLFYFINSSYSFSEILELAPEDPATKAPIELAFVKPSF